MFMMECINVATVSLGLVLLIDDDQAEIGETNARLQEGVGADKHPDRSGCETLHDPLPLAKRSRPAVPTAERLQ